eukprot:4549589-Lingulodinium_polyedra.AAC.1
MRRPRTLRRHPLQQVHSEGELRCAAANASLTMSMTSKSCACCQSTHVVCPCPVMFTQPVSNATGANLLMFRPPDSSCTPYQQPSVMKPNA